VLLKAALRREEELRLCPAQQALFSQVSVEDRHGSLDWLDLVQRMQENLIREFFGRTLEEAYSPQEFMQMALGVLRTATQRYPDDPEFHTISLWRRYNRARPGKLKEGDRVPEVRLVPLEEGESSGKPVDFWSSVLPSSDNGRPLLVIASSWS
jgi:hypothetical protein